MKITLYPYDYLIYYYQFVSWKLYCYVPFDKINYFQCLLSNQDIYEGEFIDYKYEKM